MKFSWDADKAATNLRKHNVAFIDAARVFLDPLAKREQDRIVDGEERWKITGTASPHGIVVVAHTSTDDETGEEYIRIISARKAEPFERRHYARG